MRAQTDKKMRDRTKQIERKRQKKTKRDSNREMEGRDSKRKRER